MIANPVMRLGRGWKNCAPARPSWLSRNHQSAVLRTPVEELLLGEDNPQDFACPQCESRYKLIREKAGLRTSNRPVRCRVCGHVLASREGEDILKYFLIFRRAAEPHGNAMAKLSMPTETAVALRVSERMLLFCVASNTDWKHPAIPGEIVTTMVVKGLIDRDTGGALTLTDRGRAVLRAMLPDL